MGTKGVLIHGRTGRQHSGPEDDKARTSGGWPGHGRRLERRHNWPRRHCCQRLPLTRSHALSAARASLRVPNGPITSPLDGPMSASQLPS